MQLTINLPTPETGEARALLPEQIERAGLAIAEIFGASPESVLVSLRGLRALSKPANPLRRYVLERAEREGIGIHRTLNQIGMEIGLSEPVIARWMSGGIPADETFTSRQNRSLRAARKLRQLLEEK